MSETFPPSSPFANFKISDQESLRRAESGSRIACPSCKRSVKYFCYRCVRMVDGLDGPGVIPQVSLPISMKILKHEQELDSKSTAIHAKLLAPSQISIHQFYRTVVGDATNTAVSYSTCSDSSDLVDEITANPSAYVILFPDESAVELKDLPTEEFASIRNVIVIDGTWSQAAAINRTDPYCRLRRIKISPNLKTVFWRYQDLGEHCLSTIEAIYYFMREFLEAQNNNNKNDNNTAVYDGRSYTKNPDRKYTSRHRSDYIKPE